MRITYIDTAKGIGILFVVMGHIVPEIFKVAPIIYCFWVPLFFVLSGMFFRDMSPMNFFKKKIYSLIIPFIGWYIISYAVFGTLRLLKGESLCDMLKRFSDVFITNDILNIPLWFLLALFLSNIFLYLASHWSKKPYVTTIIVLVICAAGMNLDRFSIPNFLYVGSAMSNLLYLYWGYIIAPYFIEEGNNIYRKNTSFIIAICFLCSYVLE